ncbi:MAG: hypothetical protein HYV63_23405 [Candidatus Schekmanbacteria bacterium]|nr:hypothetical protein [Candidatus Schekmanbacteria bacterium]
MMNRTQRIIKKGGEKEAKFRSFAADMVELEAPPAVIFPSAPGKSIALSGADGTAVDVRRDRVAIFEEPEASEEVPNELATLAHEEAERIIQRAQLEAQALRMQAENTTLDAQAKAERLERDAFVRGLRAGELEAKEAADGRLEEALGRVAEALKELALAQQRVFDSCQRQILKLAMAIARRVVHHEIMANEEVVAAVAKAAIRRATVSEEMTARVNPADLAVIERLRPELLEIAETAQTLRIVPSNAVKRGGVILETAFGDIDARLDEQLSELEQALREGEEALRK